MNESIAYTSEKTTHTINKLLHQVLKGKVEGNEMGVCPICNGFQNVEKTCGVCGALLEDAGRVMDYYDDYSPYMPIDQMKLEDGYASDYHHEQCPHLLKCTQCGTVEVVFIQE